MPEHVPATAEPAAAVDLDAGSTTPASTRTSPQSVSEHTDAMGSITTTLSDGRQGPTFPLALIGATRVGRTDCDITFEQDRYLSPEHCTIEGSVRTMTVTDSGSLNGTFLRLRPRATLGDGSVFVFGHQVMRVRAIKPATAQVEEDGTLRRGTATKPTLWALEQLDTSGGIRDVRHLPLTGTTVGRQVGDLRFPKDTFVSTEHLHLAPSPEGLEVTDLRSSNGTWRRLTEAQSIKDDDQLLVGYTILRFHLPQI